MLKRELEERRRILLEEMAEIEEKLRPLLERRSRVEQELRPVSELLRLSGEPSDTPVSSIVSVSPRRRGSVPWRGEMVTWQAVADDLELKVGGNSAHRVVRDRRQEIHSTIQHHCDYIKPRS